MERINVREINEIDDVIPCESTRKAARRILKLCDGEMHYRIQRSRLSDVDPLLLSCLMPFCCITIIDCL